MTGFAYRNTAPKICLGAALIFKFRGPELDRPIASAPALMGGCLK
jgi:hypothetical protein